MPNIINVTVGDPSLVAVTVEENTEVVNVTLNDGVFVQSGGGLFIDGFLVKKGVGNVAATIEVGDFVDGWIGTVRVSGRVNTIPVNDVSDLDMALQGEIF